jgi:penicillin amidase
MSPYFGSIDYMRARDFKAFQRSMLNWGAPTENQVYADVKGNIGWVPGGLAPKRPNWDGLLPVPGDGRYEWAGFWRGDQLPWSYNPAQGWIATANAYNIPNDYPATRRKLGFEWTNPARHMRVNEVLGSLSRISNEDSERLQNDILSIPARRIIALLAPLSSDDARTKAALDLLRGWDGRQPAESPQAALFEVWQTRHLRKAFREAVMPPAAAAALPTTDMNRMLEWLEQPTIRFGANPAAARNALLLSSLAGAFAEMEKLQGADPGAWQWGKLHHNLNEHSFAAVVDDATRARINVGPIPKHGSEYTPNQSLYRASDFRQLNGPSFRVIVDVGNWDNSRAINHPGQSGDPDSPHYRDLAPSWREGKYFPLLYSRQAVETAAEKIIRLVPGRKE